MTAIDRWEGYGHVARIKRGADGILLLEVANGSRWVGHEFTQRVVEDADTTTLACMVSGVASATIGPMPNGAILGTVRLMQEFVKEVRQ